MNNQFENAGESLTKQRKPDLKSWTKRTLFLLATVGLPLSWAIPKIQSNKPIEFRNDRISVRLKEQGISDARLAFVPTLDYSPAVLIESREVPYRAREAKTFTLAILPDGNVFGLDADHKWRADILGHMEAGWTAKGRMAVQDPDPNKAIWEGPHEAESIAVRRALNSGYDLR